MNQDITNEHYRNDFIKENFHLIIPFLCIVFWGLLYLYVVGFILGREFDFGVYYEGGKQIQKNPEDLYKVSGYAYLPARAFLYSITFSLFPLIIAASIHYVLVFIFGFLYIREFDKILILMDLKEKIHRFPLLLIISNGTYVLTQFEYNQEKFLIAFLLFFILRRELLFRKEEMTKDLKYYLINYGLFVYIVAIAPYLLLIIVVYIFHDIKLNELFSKFNLKKYGICVGMFFIQNFLLILYPNLIIDFLLSESTVQLEGDLYIMLIYIMFLSILPLILIIKKDLSIEARFGWFFFVWIFVGRWGASKVIVYPLSFLIFLPFLDIEDKTLKGFIFNNNLISIGLSAVIILFFIPREVILYYFVPALLEYHVQIRVIKVYVLPAIYGVFLIVFILQRKGIIWK
ncbi:MAG: hypothetical protein ACFFDN_01645 [Candidatus Hodarchaeota archaeon]